jgi:hypothetical protein
MKRSDNEEPTGEERSEIERQREDPDDDFQEVQDESEPWAKFSSGRDPDE